MPAIEITQEALDALESSKFETASDAILAAMPKKRSRKPESWKRFFDVYPQNKRGAFDKSAWDAAKRMFLDSDDFQLMVENIEQRKILTPRWYSTFAPGICNYIKEGMWLVKIIPEVSNYGQNQPARVSHAQRSESDTEQLLAFAGAYETNSNAMGRTVENLPESMDSGGRGIYGGARGIEEAHEEFCLVAEEDGTFIQRGDNKGAEVL